MKRITLTALVFCMSIAAQAQPQENFDPFKDREFIFDSMHICTIMLVIYMIASFILQLFKNGMSFRLKNRILDKGTEENIVKELLLPDKKDNTKYILQWFLMLTAIGIGLLLVGFTRPFGLHSLAILAFSIAAGFGAFYYFSREK
jgi:hypothetical protein